MLNRRLIRVRAMQTLYAFEKAKGANFLLAQDLITEVFSPDLNSMEVQNKTKLLGYQKLATSVFTDEIQKSIGVDEDNLPQVVKAAVIKARDFLKLKNKKDFENISLQCLADAEKVYDIYLYLITLLFELAAKFPANSGLYNNKIVKVLGESKELESLALKRGVKWEDERIFINKVYNEALKNNPHIIEYNEKVNHTLDEQLGVLKYLIKNVLLKHEICEEFFEKMNLFWLEDKEILRTMLSHTIMGFPETGAIKIEKLDDVWEESKDFLKILFKETVLEDEKLSKILIPFLKNWDFERIVETDKILLKMAITELTNFPSIPVKVTINEVIEIAKNFSSAKSGQFINGILDSVIVSLTKKGEIKKSGRGMLDNK
jgi:transcription antitermination protein NusB